MSLNDLRVYKDGAYVPTNGYMQKALSKAIWNDETEMDEARSRLQHYLPATPEQEITKLELYAINCPKTHLPDCQKAIAYLLSTTSNKCE